MPPSSSETGTMFSAAARPMRRAVGTEPVKEILATPGCETRAAPASSPMPWTTLRTPGGSPCLLGEVGQEEQVAVPTRAASRTAVQPAASAGPTFQVESMKGAFHGVMSAATPDGSCRVWWR